MITPDTTRRRYTISTPKSRTPISVTTTYAAAYGHALALAAVTLLPATLEWQDERGIERRQTVEVESVGALTNQAIRQARA